MSLTLALSKGRIFDDTLPLLKAAGIEVLDDPSTSRALILRDGSMAYDGSLSDLLRRVRGQRYVIDLDGRAPESFIGAMRDLGVAPERISRAPATWEDIVEAVAQGEQP